MWIQNFNSLSDRSKSDTVRNLLMLKEVSTRKALEDGQPHQLKYSIRQIASKLQRLASTISQKLSGISDVSIYASMRSQQ